MQQLLFRDWRFALLWAVGLTALLAAFFSEGGGHEQLIEKAEQISANRDAQADSAAGKASAVAPPASQDEEADEAAFEEPEAETPLQDPAPEPGAEPGQASPAPLAEPAQL